MFFEYTGMELRDIPPSFWPTVYLLELHGMAMLMEYEIVNMDNPEICRHLWKWWECNKYNVPHVPDEDWLSKFVFRLAGQLKSYAIAHGNDWSSEDEPHQRGGRLLENVLLDACFQDPEFDRWLSSPRTIKECPPESLSHKEGPERN